MRNIFRTRYEVRSVMSDDVLYAVYRRRWWQRRFRLVMRKAGFGWRNPAVFVKSVDAIMCMRELMGFKRGSEI